uniref:Uncharacterized protein n=1 Tax=Panagrolaimus superbus TaxID=310955 RepID=A0A914Y249_9BILA
MTSTVYRERSQDSVIVLSDSDGEKEEKCLKIHYQESLEFFEIPMESDGRISLEDVISMDPKIFALIVQKDGYRKLVKPKNGYWKEPKEKWKNFKVFFLH